MPASLYRLVGKPHYTEAATAEAATSPVEEPVVVQETPAPVPVVEHVEAAIDAEPVIEKVEPVIADNAAATIVDAPVTVADEIEIAPAVEAEPVTVAPEAPARPVWDPSWSKAKLLEVAVSFNLPVTVDSTRNQIIAALTNFK